MRRTGRWAIALIALVAAGGTLRAQSGSELLRDGIRAYGDLEMIAAATLLRRALAGGELDDAARARALAYLGAAEFYRDRPDSARAAFGRLIVLDPRYRPDPMVFAPEVSAAFGEVRRSTLVTAVRVPRRASFPPGREGFVIWIVPSTPHDVAVAIQTSDGGALRTLHRGRVDDSVRVAWDGRRRGGAALAPGLYILSVSSRDPEGTTRRTVEVPLRLAEGFRDSLPPPPPPVLLPERTPAGPAFARLGLGAAAAVAAVVLMPVMVSDAADETAARISAGVVYTAAGVIGFLERHPGRPHPDNVVANAATRAAWQTRADSVASANRARRPGERVVIETGRAVVREPGR